MASGKVKRLSKIAKEFNLGISTIVDFLKDKGFDTESSPNAKISEEAYSLLAKEYKSDKSANQAVENIDIKVNKKNTSVELHTDTSVVDLSENKNDEFIKTEAPNKIKLSPKGKIDLEGISNAKNKKEESKEEEAPKPKPKKEEKKEEKTEATKEKAVVAEEAPVKKEKPAVKENTPEENVKKPQTQETNEVKVVGKIDLDSLNQKTRPARKSKKEKEKERKERIQKAKEQKEANKKNQNNNNNNSDSDDKSKKKRKRIKKGAVNPNSNANQPQEGPGKKKAKKKLKKKTVKAEVSEEDVQKQIKDTLAKLTKKKGKAAKYRKDKRTAIHEKSMQELEQQELDKRTLKVTEFVTVSELASMMDMDATKVIATCMSLGMFVSINQRLDAETMSLVAEEFGYEIEFISAEVQEAIKEEEDSEEDLETRPPIITVMGHVDHGKTSLLDYIRETNVIAGESGGITQHIGAYSVELKNGKRVSFLDTPGHEAFTAMRARGAQATDIVIVVVAADDGVKPQTKEAINHAQAAGVPIVFAINKIDKPGANPDRVKEELANMNFLVEDWGGKYQSQEVSAKNGDNIEELMDKVLLEAEMLELKANPNKKAVGSVVESSLDKGRGYVATVLVSSGTLKVGDIMLAGSFTGRVKAMYNERNQLVDAAGPSVPVLILGLDGAPQAGDKFNIMDNEKEAKEIATKRNQLQREQGLRTQKTLTLDEIGRRIAIGNFQELNIVVKGDVDGSIEALSDSLIKLSTDEIQINIIHKGVGEISETDVMLAEASDAIIVGFQVRPSLAARKSAEKSGVDIRMYSIIYDAIEEVKQAMEGMLSPEIKEEITSTVEIRAVYKISKVGSVAGCMVKDGKISRNDKIRLIREGIVIYTGELDSLRRVKDDVKEVKSGFECGLNIKNYNDIKEGDIVESFKETESKRTL